MRIFAEDDRSQAESIQSWLELDGYQVDWVNVVIMPYSN